MCLHTRHDATLAATEGLGFRVLGYRVYVARLQVPQFTCFTGTKVQILTQFTADSDRCVAASMRKVSSSRGSYRYTLCSLYWDKSAKH
jgi:hypothetical protein